MKEIPNQIPENNAENTPNFHEISETRKELRKAIKGLDNSSAGKKPSLKDKNERRGLSMDLERDTNIAKTFKVADYGGIRGSVDFLKKQKDKAEEILLPVDLDAIYAQFPEYRKIEETESYIHYLKDKRMKEMFALKGANTEGDENKYNRHLKNTKDVIEDMKTDLEKFPALDLRARELIGYKQNLSEGGHICITPSVEKDLEAIGDRMLTGKPMFLHGPTGTGKTSLARFAATHFTGKDPEMIYCNPQTKESNVWGKTSIKPTEDGGAIFTYIELGPLAKAIKEGKTVIFDEFTALPKEQMVFIKAVFAVKPGDKINVVGDGLITVAQGFQAVFTANLKSEKNPERQDLPPEIAREFEQNNLEVKYTPQGEAYDIMLSRLLNRDGSLDMSFYDLNTTLPNLCKVMSEIQESYTNETDKEVARRAGAMDASGKVYSLKKFVMTQGSVEAILSSWLIEKQTGKEDRSFAEFLDERFKTALTFKEYPKEDRVLVAKILASKGFLLTLNAKDLDLPEDIFKLNTIKAMRGEDAVEELQKESGAVKHLTLKEVAELDPFNKRPELLKKQAEALLGDEKSEKDLFLNGLNKKMGKIFGKEKNNQKAEISTEYSHPDGKKETITLNLENKLADFISFYKKTNIDLPQDFEDSVREIWDRNQVEIEKAIEQNGFDDMLIVPGNIPLADLAEKMKMEKGYYFYQVEEDFSNVKSQNTDKPRIILYHKKTLPEVQAETGLDVHLNITAGDALKLFKQNPNEHMTLPDFMIMERKIFEESGIHISDYTKNSGQWLNTKVGTRLVTSRWNPGHGELLVGASDPEDRSDNRGLRPARCFF